MAIELKDPWLVAAWPGMGGVALVAGSFLVQRLGAEPVAEIPPGDYFDVQRVQVKDGLAQPARPSRSLLYGWKDPAGQRDLLIFLGEEQPAVRGYAFCEELIGLARGHGVTRVVTFAAMATPVHPRERARVFAVATDRNLLAQVRRLEVELLADGEISGLNGVLLSAAAAAGIPAACLLGEFPYFASGVPNPKASAAALRVFRDLAGLTLDIDELEEQARLVEDKLVTLLERLERASETAAEAHRAGLDHDEDDEDDDEEAGSDPEVISRIEELFEQARRDRGKALELKGELDRHGLFRRYEDRFLDLFKQAE